MRSAEPHLQRYPDCHERMTWHRVTCYSDTYARSIGLWGSALGGTPPPRGERPSWISATPIRGRHEHAVPRQAAPQLVHDVRVSVTFEPRCPHTASSCA